MYTLNEMHRNLPEEDLKVNQESYVNSCFAFFYLNRFNVTNLKIRELSKKWVEKISEQSPQLANINFKRIMATIHTYLESDNYEERLQASEAI